jgi:preprotein translocase subunit SecD
VSRRQIEDNAVAQALETIRNRIDEFGVSEPLIARQGKDRILVQLPGIDDPKRVKDLIKNTAFLELSLVEAGPATQEALTANYPGPDPRPVQAGRGQDRAGQPREVVLRGPPPGP